MRKNKTKVLKTTLEQCGIVINDMGITYQADQVQQTTATITKRRLLISSRLVSFQVELLLPPSFVERARRALNPRQEK